MTFSEKSDIIKVQKRKREEKSEKKTFQKKNKKDLTNKVESDIIKMSKGENNSLRYKKIGLRPTQSRKTERKVYYD